MGDIELHVLTGRALTDQKFQDDLLRRPDLVCQEFDLTDEERELVFRAAHLAGGSLIEFAKVLEDSEIVRRRSHFPLSSEA